MKNLVISPDGKVVSVIVEVGGFWGIGDTHASVPCDRVEVLEEEEAIQIPVTEKTLEDYSVFKDVALSDSEASSGTFKAEEDVLAIRAWKAMELLGYYVLLNNGAAYGYVEDLIFDQVSQLQAVIIHSEATQWSRPLRLSVLWCGFGQSSRARILHAAMHLRAGRVSGAVRRLPPQQPQLEHIVRTGDPRGRSALTLHRLPLGRLPEEELDEAAVVDAVAEVAPARVPHQGTEQDQPVELHGYEDGTLPIFHARGPVERSFLRALIGDERFLMGLAKMSWAS